MNLNRIKNSAQISFKKARSTVLLKILVAARVFPSSENQKTF